jgi:bifunctional DNA-binding transcriptional regulator/antitoxin component of YhaV-PrlF toxin-antitoxin module
MPLTHRITFKTSVKKQYRIAVPKILRWQYKLESLEVLKVTMSAVREMEFRRVFFGEDLQ